MKALIARLLRHRSSWQLVVIAAVMVSVALLISYNVYSSTRRAMGPVFVVLYAIAGTALILACVRIAEEGGGARRWSTRIGAVVGLGGLIAAATYGFGHLNTEMRGSCNGALLADTYAERKADLEAAEAKLKQPLAWLPRLWDDVAGRDCARTRADLERVEQGLCTQFTLVDRPCVCGAESFPYARCKQPNCLMAPGLPDKFDCPGDMIPPEYIVPRE